MRIVAWFIASCLLLVVAITLAVIGALYFESHRPAPERKPEPTVLEIGE